MEVVLSLKIKHSYRLELCIRFRHNHPTEKTVLWVHELHKITKKWKNKKGKNQLDDVGNKRKCERRD